MGIRTGWKNTVLEKTFRLTAWANKNPALDIISIGPEILDIHSPKETLILESVDNCDALVRAVLRRIAGK